MCFWIHVTFYLKRNSTRVNRAHSCYVMHVRLPKRNYNLSHEGLLKLSEEKQKQRQTPSSFAWLMHFFWLNIPGIFWRRLYLKDARVESAAKIAGWIWFVPSPSLCYEMFKRNVIEESIFRNRTLMKGVKGVHRHCNREGRPGYVVPPGGGRAVGSKEEDGEGGRRLWEGLRRTVKWLLAPGGVNIQQRRGSERLLTLEQWRLERQTCWHKFRREED